MGLMTGLYHPSIYASSVLNNTTFGAARDDNVGSMVTLEWTRNTQLTTSVIERKYNLIILQLKTHDNKHHLGLNPIHLF